MRVNNNSRVNKAYKVVREFNPEEMNELIKLLKEDKEARKRELIPLMDAKKAAKAVICSSLVKAAMFGSDANWGRVLCAIGYSGAETDVTRIDVAFRSAKGSITVCEMGASVDFSEETAKEILSEKEITIAVTMRDGDASSVAWGSDLTYDYVRINGDYRT